LADMNTTNKEAIDNVKMEKWSTKEKTFLALRQCAGCGKEDKSPKRD
jgi:hypothetical protein